MNSLFNDCVWIFKDFHGLFKDYSWIIQGLFMDYSRMIHGLFKDYFRISCVCVRTPNGNTNTVSPIHNIWFIQQNMFGLFVDYSWIIHGLFMDYSNPHYKLTKDFGLFKFR